jgi:hypothetical protein
MTATADNPRLADIIQLEEILDLNPFLTEGFTAEGKRLPTLQRAAAVIAGQILSEENFPKTLDDSLVNILGNVITHTLWYAANLGLTDDDLIQELCDETGAYVIGTILSDNEVLDRLDQDKYDAAVAVTLNDLLTTNDKTF